MDVIDTYAPGLRTLGATFAQLGATVALIRAAWESSDPGLLLSGGVDSLITLFILVGINWLILCIILRQIKLAIFHPAAPAGKVAVADEPLRVRRRPWYKRLNAWRRDFFLQPWYWRVGGVTAYLNQTHALLVGGSGSGKSTAVVSMILQPTVGLKMRLFRMVGQWRRRPVVILSFDRSDPIEEATNELEDAGIPVVRWRVRRPYGWDMLQGDVEMLAEALPTIWPESAGSTGFFKQLMSDAISAALTQMDQLGHARTWHEMVERCNSIMEDDDETPDLARRTWIRRFRSLGRILGDSLGNDFDLVSALQAGSVVHISGNSYENPSLTPLVGVAGISQVKRAAEVVHGAILILEEAAFLKQRSAEMEDLFRSIRARGWRILYLTQDPQDLGSVLEVNAAVALIMGLGPLAHRARKWCADVVQDLPGAFKAAEIILGTSLDQLEGYLIAGRKGVQEVSLNEYITAEAVHREHPARVHVRDELDPQFGQERPATVVSDRAATAQINLDTSGSDTTQEAGSITEEIPVIRQQVRRPIEGPVAMPDWMDGHRLKPDQRDVAQLKMIWLRHVWPYGIEGCWETTYSLNAEGSNGRPRCNYMGKSWLVYALLLAVYEGLDLNEVSMLMRARAISVEHKCENGRCVNVEQHCEWDATGDNSKLFHSRRRKALAEWQSLIEAEVDTVPV